MPNPPYGQIEVLGRGGGAYVFRGRHHETGDEVALKRPNHAAWAMKASSARRSRLSTCTRYGHSSVTVRATISSVKAGRSQTRRVHDSRMSNQGAHQGG